MNCQKKVKINTNKAGCSGQNNYCKRAIVQSVDVVIQNNTLDNTLLSIQYINNINKTIYNTYLYMILYTLLFTTQVNNYFALTSLHMGTDYRYKLLQRYIHSSSTDDTVASLSLNTFHSLHTVTTTHKLQTIHGS